MLTACQIKPNDIISLERSLISHSLLDILKPKPWYRLHKTLGLPAFSNTLPRLNIIPYILSM